MAHPHFEPFLQLAGLTHDDALLAWGGFYFRDPDADGDDFLIVEDPDLEEVTAPPRRDTIGARSRPYGEAEIEVIEEDSGRVAARVATSETNYAWVRGLLPDTAYRYRVTVDGKPWAQTRLRDWIDTGGGPDLVTTDRTYENRFRTFPHPDEPAPLRFAVLGDYGVGILASGGRGQRQRRLAAALERAVDTFGIRLVLTTGDNVYIGEEDTVAGTGEHDDDWYFSFYEPYRYVINRVPVYPGVGNHDTSDTERSDDRGQLADNLYTDLRFADEAEAGRSSVDPGLYYRFSYGADVEFVAVDTTKADEFEERYFFDNSRHRAFLEEAFPADPPPRPRWRIPFSHHPPFCAGPHHQNMDALVERVVPLLERAGVHLMLSGHEHNFQHAATGGVDYIVSGAGGKLREERPGGWDEAHTLSWAAECHMLLVDLDADRIVVHPVTDVSDDGALTYISARTAAGGEAEMPIVIGHR